LIKGSQKDAKTSSDFDETFTYLENLVANHLKGRPEKSVICLQGKGRIENNSLTLHEVLSSIYDMFLMDAKEKQLEFTYIPTSLSVNVDSLVLMRIITNLVANAIKYTNTGKIALGCRRAGNVVFIQVHDTGIGLTKETFLLAQQREARLGVEKEDPGGFGYGLAIVRELVDKNGLKLTLMEGRALGASISVEFPRA
jgi:signal transduction histidine kinase